MSSSLQQNDAQFQAFVASSVRSQSGLFNYLEQVVAKDCPATRSPVLLGKNNSTKIAVFFRPRCGMWSCPVCAEVNRQLWISHAIHGTKAFIALSAAIDFVTVTSHEKLSPEATISVLPSAWNKLRCRMARAAPGQLAYFQVPERHRDERLHLHMIVSCSLGKRWWKDHARSSGFGYMSDVQEVIAAGGVGGYVGKYLGKAISETRWAKNFRRVRTSQNWPKMSLIEASSDLDFEKVSKDVSLWELAVTLKLRGFQVTFAGSSSAWDVLETGEDHGNDNSV